MKVWLLKIGSVDQHCLANPLRRSFPSLGFCWLGRDTALVQTPRPSRGGGGAERHKAVIVVQAVKR